MAPRASVRLLRWILCAGFLCGLAAFAWSRRDVIVEAELVNKSVIGYVFATVVAEWYCASRVSGLILRSCGRQMANWRIAVGTVAAVAGNYLPLRAGSIARALYFKRECGLPLTHYGALMVAYGVVGAATVGVVLIALLAVSDSFAEVGWTATGVILACATLPLAGFAVLARISRGYFRQSPKLRRLAMLAEGMELIAANPRRVILAGAWYMGAVVMGAFRLWLIYGGLGTPISASACLFITAAATLSMLVPLAPGGLGLREGTVALAGALFGISVETGLLAATLERGVFMVATVVVGGPSLLWITRGIGASERNTASEAGYERVESGARRR